jgi:hypothetical protein
MLAGPDHGTTLDPTPFFASAVNPANRTLDAIRSGSGSQSDYESRYRNGRAGSRRDA